MPGGRKFWAPPTELTQVDASGCESGDNGGKGNSTVPGFRPRRGADGISNSLAAAAAAVEAGTAAAFDAVNGLEIS